MRSIPTAILIGLLLLTACDGQTGLTGAPGRDGSLTSLPCTGDLLGSGASDASGFGRAVYVGSAACEGCHPAGRSVPSR